MIRLIPALVLVAFTTVVDFNQAVACLVLALAFLFTPFK